MSPLFFCCSSNPINPDSCGTVRNHQLPSIHLNLLRAKLVNDYQQLHTYPFCGHSAIMGEIDREWQEMNGFLAMETLLRKC